MHEVTKAHLTAVVQEQFDATVNAVVDRIRAKSAMARKQKELDDATGLYEAAVAVEEVQKNMLFEVNDKAELINAGTTTAEARRLLTTDDTSRVTTHPETSATQSNVITAIISDQKERPNG